MGQILAPIIILLESNNDAEKICSHMEGRYRPCLSGACCISALVWPLLKWHMYDVA